MPSSTKNNKNNKSSTSHLVAWNSVLLVLLVIASVFLSLSKKSFPIVATATAFLGFFLFVVVVLHHDVMGYDIRRFSYVLLWILGVLLLADAVTASAFLIQSSGLEGGGNKSQSGEDGGGGGGGGGGTELIEFGQTGGTVSTEGPYTIITWSSPQDATTVSGTFTIKKGNQPISYLVVGGGGAGGNGGGGGGGGGGMVSGELDTYMVPTTFSISAGAGGKGSAKCEAVTDGSDSSITSDSLNVTASGGGKGATIYPCCGQDNCPTQKGTEAGKGGSGGGGSGYNACPTGAEGIKEQGFRGGDGFVKGSFSGGGGGGAGSVGSMATASGGADGGNGLEWVDGKWYAGGGGGASGATGLANGKGGNGGGGDASSENNAKNGMNGLGGGGGGQGAAGYGKVTSGNGGNGVVILAFYTNGTPSPDNLSF